MTRPRLFLHIGHPKTGTTTIQSFLLANRDALRRHGVLVPAAGVIEGNHQGLTENYFSVRGRENRTEFHTHQLLRELADHRCPVTVLSSEGFIQENPERFARLFQPAFEVVIVYYIRRQDLAVQSVYAQRVRSYVQLETRPILPLVRELTPRYRLHLDRFARVFGANHCRLRPFEKAAFAGGTLITDFLALLDVPPGALPVRDEPRNSAFKRPYLEFKRRANLLPLLEGEHRALGRGLDACSLADSRPHPRHCLSPVERRAILDGCAAENAALARDFLGRADGRLFLEPPPADDDPFQPVGELPAAEQHAILDALPPAVSQCLEFLHRPTRLRLPGRPFLPESPKKPDELARAIARREADKIQRRLAILERQAAQPPPNAAPPAGPLAAARRFVGRFLRARRRR